MRVPIVVPNLGPCDEPVRLNSWFLEEGDWVVTGDLVVELMISGVSFDVASSISGQLVEISKTLDSTTESGDVLGWLESPTVEFKETDLES